MRLAEEQNRIKQKEAELAQRELSLLERELTMHMMYNNNQVNQTPTPKKRMGKFRYSLDNFCSYSRTIS